VQVSIVARYLVCTVLLSAAISSAQSAELSGYVVLTSDYVWRGVSQSDGDPALQLGGDVAFGSGIYAGLWGSTIDIDNGAGRYRDTELTYYLGYSHGIDTRWSIGASVIVYTYPGQTGTVDYDYEELMLTANFDDRLWLEYAYSPDLYNTDRHSHNVQVFTEWPVGKRLVVGAGVGYYDVSDFVGDGYTYWELGVTMPVNRFDFDLRYHDTSRAVPVISTPERAESRIALSVRLIF
jgi:uncharacterized protein (TIGR02001 family)